MTIVGTLKEILRFPFLLSRNHLAQTTFEDYPLSIELGHSIKIDHEDGGIYSIVGRSYFEYSDHDGDYIEDFDHDIPLYRYYLKEKGKNEPLSGFLQITMDERGALQDFCFFLESFRKKMPKDPRKTFQVNEMGEEFLQSFNSEYYQREWGEDILSKIRPYKFIEMQEFLDGKGQIKRQSLDCEMVLYQRLDNGHDKLLQFVNSFSFESEANFCIGKEVEQYQVIF